MRKCFGILGMIAIVGFSSYASADDSMNFNQKTLPNGDVESTFSSADGHKMVSTEHPDGSVETTTTTADGTKAVTTQRKDGSSETHVTQPGH